MIRQGSWLSVYSANVESRPYIFTPISAPGVMPTDVPTVLLPRSKFDLEAGRRCRGIKRAWCAWKTTQLAASYPSVPRCPTHRHFQSTPERCRPATSPEAMRTQHMSAAMYVLYMMFCTCSVRKAKKSSGFVLRKRKSFHPAIYAQIWVPS